MRRRTRPRWRCCLSSPRCCWALLSSSSRWSSSASRPAAVGGEGSRRRGARRYAARDRSRSSSSPSRSSSRSSRCRAWSQSPPSLRSNHQSPRRRRWSSDRHRDLYDDEYARQLDRVETLRQAIRTRLAVGVSSQPESAAMEAVMRERSSPLVVKSSSRRERRPRRSDARARWLPALASVALLAAFLPRAPPRHRPARRGRRRETAATCLRRPARRSRSSRRARPPPFRGCDRAGAAQRRQRGTQPRNAYLLPRRSRARAADP